MFLILNEACSGWMLSLIVCLPYWFLYRYEFSFIEQYKIEKHKPWPWYTDPDHRYKVVKALSLMVFNSTITNALNQSFWAYMYNWSYPWKDTRVETIPDSWTMFKQVMICVMCEDFFFYWGHRILHCKSRYLPLYQYIHKTHHEF